MRSYYKKGLLLLLCILFIPYGITMIVSGYMKKGSKNESTLIIVVEDEGSSIKVNENSYIEMVLAAEISPNYEMETLKAQACIIRTYLYDIVTQKNQNQVNAEDIGLSYWPEKKQSAIWAENAKKYQEKIHKAVTVTNQKVIYYKKSLIVPLYHVVSTGVTRDVKDVIHREIPYLVSVESKEDVMSSEYLVIQNYTKQDFIKKLQQEFPNCELAEEMSEEAIQVLDRSEDGYVNLIKINKQTVTGEQFASCFSLGSTNFCIESYEDRIRIVCRGKGHGIGFSQFGGNQRAKQGDSYDKILEYYYSGTEVKDWIK